LRDKKGRFAKQTPTAMKSLSFLINRGIHDNGILPTKFFTKPFEAEWRAMQKRVPEAIERELNVFFNKG
jgi:hypothetical protein